MSSSSACGGRLLLYFVQTPATHAAARLAGSREPLPGPPGCLTRGGSGGWGRSKGGGDAAGRRRGHSQPAPPSSARPRLRLRQLPPRRSGPLRRWQASGQMSPSSACGGRLLLYFLQMPASGSACGQSRASAQAAWMPDTRGEGLVCEVKEEVTTQAGAGDIRTQAPLPALDQPASLLDDATKTRPRCSGGRARRESAVEGAGVRTRS